MKSKEAKKVLKEIDKLLKNSVKGEEIPKEAITLLEEIASGIESKDEESKDELNQKILDKLDMLIGFIPEDNSDDIISAIEKIKIVVPTPQVSVEAPKVEVTVPEIKIPKIEIPKTTINFPDEMKVKKPSWIEGLVNTKPITDLLNSIKTTIGSFKLPTRASEAISVRLSNGKEFYQSIGGSSSSASIPTYKNSLGEVKQGLVDDSGHVQVDLNSSPIDDLIHENDHTGESELRVFSEGHVCIQNSTNVALGANQTFVGSWQDTLDYSEVITTIYTDQNSTTDGFKIWWSADGITSDPDPDVFTISKNVSKTFSFPCNRRYVKITYQNDGVASSFLILSTLLKRFASKGSSHRLLDSLNQEDDAIVTKTLIAGKTSAGGTSIVDVKVNPSGALNVAATQDGTWNVNNISGTVSLPTGAATNSAQTDGTQKTRLTDQYGFIGELTPTGELRAISPVRLCGSIFSGSTVDPNFWTVTNANNGTTTQAGSLLTIATNTTSANGSSIVHSVAVARHTGGSINRYRGQLRLSDTGATDNSRKWGAFNSTDGCYFELDGTTLYAVTLKASTPTRVASANWNGSTTVPTLTNTTTYEIYITSGKVYFVISDVLVHTATFATTTWTDKTNLPIGMSSTNSNNLQTNHTIEARAVTIYRLGELETSPRYSHISSATTTILKYSAGMIHNIILNNPTNNTITIYDNTAGNGTVIAIINPGSSATPFALDYHVPFQNGLTVVTAGTPDLTIVYE